ncbi:dienelactone hydrolase family protein [Psychroflexus sp. YR1-1]|uniref:Dienelactone hydrolase family protein n=1 Tax=Psychroflexus aurantiacus TaxID=2709310 RepID=A0A6B3QZY1_9FLAO|nr:dienelactone hydrolase family protein [Psychroflexus aurantiacus]NEV93422.1 dienelactone hydrolase family protein [Psychroflexus aurantiacus]
MKSLFTILGLVFSMLAFSQTDLQVLERSPRHQEWVELQSNGRALHSFVVYPEVSENAKVFIVIHENRGLNDWARRFADELAEKGFIAIAPDLLSNASEGISKTSDFENSDAARTAIYNLDQDQVMTDLDSVFDYARSIAAGTGEVSVIGFCWGGSQSFRYATHNQDLEAAFVFYGIAPEAMEDLVKIEVPVYGFYGGKDARVNATISETEENMNSLGKNYTYSIYENGGHGFMRSGAQPDASPGNKTARAKAWEDLLSRIQF